MSFSRLRDHVVSVTNGEVTEVNRATPGRNIRWNIAVEPDWNNDLSLTVLTTTDCAGDSAV